MESGISEALETGRAWQSQSQRKIKEGKQGKQARARARVRLLQTTTAVYDCPQGCIHFDRPLHVRLPQVVSDSTVGQV